MELGCLRPGDVLDGEGGSLVYGSLVEAQYARERDLLPIGLPDRARVTRLVAPDAMLTMADVDLPGDTFVGHLRKVQDATLA